MVEPSRGGYGHFEACIDVNRLGILVPGTAQPHVSFTGYARRGDCVVEEYVAPLCCFSMVRGYDIASALAHNVHGVVLYQHISLAIYKVYGAFQQAVGEPGTVCVASACVPSVLIGAQFHLVHHQSVAVRS